jgi:hypothetical protein
LSRRRLRCSQLALAPGCSPADSTTAPPPACAAADPTAIEAEVRKQMAERAAAHEDRNLARMLTPSERK